MQRSRYATRTWLHAEHPEVPSFILEIHQHLADVYPITTQTDGLPKSWSGRGPLPVTLFACFGVRTSKTWCEHRPETPIQQSKKKLGPTLIIR